MWRVNDASVATLVATLIFMLDTAGVDGLEWDFQTGVLRAVCNQQNDLCRLQGLEAKMTCFLSDLYKNVTLRHLLFVWLMQPCCRLYNNKTKLRATGRIMVRFFTKWGWAVRILDNTHTQRMSKPCKGHLVPFLAIKIIVKTVLGWRTEIK